MAYTSGKLTKNLVRTLGPGRHSDGHGLYLVVDPSGARRWIVRVTVNPQGMIDLIDSCPHQWSYRAGVVSFAREDAPTEDQQQEVIDRFEEIAFAGLDADRFACLWVRHTHEDRVELHFCTPRMELHGGRSLNIAPPGYERAFDSLRDLMNKTHGWADPMDAERVAEVRRGCADQREYGNA